MNDQIKALLIKAIKEIGPDDDDHGAKEKTLDKFATLIIKECAKTAAYFSIEHKRIHPDIDPRDMSPASHMVYHSTCQRVAEEIRTHFGVE